MVYKKTSFEKYGIPILLSCVLVLTLIPISIYLYNYDSVILTNNPEYLGVWGDFYNPFIALINGCILVYLTFEVRRLDEKRENNREQLEDKRLQQSLDVQLMITISQMRNEKAITIIQLFDTFHFSDMTDNLYFDSEKLLEIEKTFSLFLVNTDYLFSDFVSTTDNRIKVERLLEIMPKLSITTRRVYDLRIRNKEVVKQLRFKNEQLEKYILSDNEALRGQIPFIKEELDVISKNYETTKSELLPEEEDMKTLSKEYTSLKNDFIKGLNLFIINDLKK